jgi:hypothetical protein
MLCRTLDDMPEARPMNTEADEVHDLPSKWL